MSTFFKTTIDKFTGLENLHVAYGTPELTIWESESFFSRNDCTSDTELALTVCENDKPHYSKLHGVYRYYTHTKDNGTITTSPRDINVAHYCPDPKLTALHEYAHFLHLTYCGFGVYESEEQQEAVADAASLIALAWFELGGELVEFGSSTMLEFYHKRDWSHVWSCYDSFDDDVLVDAISIADYMCGCCTNIDRNWFKLFIYGCFCDDIARIGLFDKITDENIVDFVEQFKNALLSQK